MLAESDLGDDSGSGQQLPVASACVTWRGDGDYVATLVEPCAADQPGSDSPATGQSASLRVWDGRTLQAHAEGEAAAALSSVAAWQPNGRHLYAAQHAGPTPRVLLFERNGNGLQHGGFNARVSGAPGSMVVLWYSRHMSCCWSEAGRSGHTPANHRRCQLCRPHLRALLECGLRAVGYHGGAGRPTTAAALAATQLALVPQEGVPLRAEAGLSAAPVLNTRCRLFRTRLTTVTKSTAVQGALHVHWDEASPTLLRVGTAGGLLTQASASVSSFPCPA